MSEKSEKCKMDCEKKLEALLKSYELVETEMDNLMQNMHTAASALFAGLIVFVLYIVNPSNCTNDPSNSLLKNIIIYSIPFLVCIISMYLTERKRTLVFNSAYAKHLEDKINIMLGGGKTIHFEQLSFPLHVSSASLSSLINISLIILYLVPFIYFVHSSQSTFLEIMKDLSLDHLIYTLIIFPITIYCILYRITIKEWGDEVVKHMENCESNKIPKLLNLILKKFRHD